ncbi:MAG TPA: ABC transporter permease subunit, partial [Caulifigura sp.]|nr:ABC transporter permease subunit [Caulifigura sp.]
MARSSRVLPGFGLGLSSTIAVMTALLAVPLLAVVFKASTLGWSEFWSAIWSLRARNAYALTVTASLGAAVIDSVIGLLIAWVLVRYDFLGKRLFDSLIDLPFALPTAVAGLVYSSLYVENGWLGQFLVPLGIHGAYSRFGIVLVLSFIGLPFVVRTLQPVLESFDADVEEAAASLGASRLQVFW